MPSVDPSGHNIGDLTQHGFSLTTREVLALLHEVCRDAAAAFPRSADDLWITDTGELLIARSDQLAAPIDPRAGVAALLESMLPEDGSSDPERVVPRALRGLPARLRAATEDVGPQDRRDLMSILAWHIGGDPRQVIQQLAQRLAKPHTDAAAADVQDDIDLFPAAEAPAETAAVVAAPHVEPERLLQPVPQPAAVPAPPVAIPGDTRGRAATVFAILGIAFLFVGIGSGSYWLFRNRDAAVPEQIANSAAEAMPEAATTAVAPSAPPVTAEPPDQPRIVPLANPHLLSLDVRDGAFSPAFAASGRELFFHSGRSNSGRLFVADLDDSYQVSRISAVRDEGARDYHPRVSPDGRWIAFDSDRDGERGVYVAARDGSNPQRVSGPGYAAVPSWSPEMKWLAFVRGEPARPRVWNLWLRDLSTGALQRHTAFRSGQVWGASWFPGGRTLAYSHDEDLIISDLDGREDIIINSPKPGHLVRTPAVSPDGKSVVFQVFRDGVWLFDVETRAMRRLFDDPSAEEFAWSPDGDRIAYHSRRDGTWKIWVATVK